jgi:hypothetical protein
MVLRKAHRIAVVRLARDASTHPPSRFIAREKISAPMMVRSRQTGSRPAWSGMTFLRIVVPLQLIVGA